MPEDVGQAKQEAGGEPEAAKDAVDWRTLIEDAVANRPEPITAETYLGKWTPSAASPVRLRCSDGGNYAVKGPQVGRMAFNDQAAVRLGQLLGAPVPEDAALVQVSQELIDNNQQHMGKMSAGIGHGTKEIEDTTDRLGLQHLDEGDNRARFASLAIFFGWMGGADQQFIYKKSPPQIVHSVDHGHFFYAGGHEPNWTVDLLRQAPPAQADEKVTQYCKFTQEELVDACASLRDVTPEQIAEALAVPPDGWGVTLDERVALASYLHKRRAELLAAYSPDDDDQEGASK